MLDDGRFHKVDRLIQTVRRQGRVRVQVRWHDARTVSERSVSWVPIGYLSDDMKERAWVMLTGRAARGVATRSSDSKQQTVQKTKNT